jgi:hypothetical protein
MVDNKGEPAPTLAAAARVNIHAAWKKVCQPQDLLRRN